MHPATPLAEDDARLNAPMSMGQAMLARVTLDTYIDMKAMGDCDYFKTAGTSMFTKTAVLDFSNGESSYPR